VAEVFEIATEGRGDLEIAGDLAEVFLAQFSWSEDPNASLKLAPKKRQELWKKLDMEPRGIDGAVVELLESLTAS
jgi:carbon-monoxide dehydrogenase catalytic subunit